MRIKTIMWVAVIMSLLFGCAKNIEEVDLAKKTIDSFYSLEKERDYKSIDKLMATRFYMATPYNKFIEFLNTKKSTFGSFEEKELITFNVAISTNSNSQVLLKYKVRYSNKETQESFTLEKYNNEFRILKYNIE